MRAWPKKKYVLKPRARSLKGWRIFGERLKKVYPLYWFWDRVVMRHIGFRKTQLFHMKWWFLHRLVPKYKYHILDSKLPPDYYCFDTVILHAAFERFSQEYPKTKNIIEFKSEDEIELDRLLEWWKTGRPAYQKAIDETWDKWHEQNKSLNLEQMLERKRTKEEKKLMDVAHKMEAQLEKDDTKNLISLIKLRGHVSW